MIDETIIPLTEGEVALLNALRNLQRLYDDRNAVILRLERTADDLRDELRFAEQDLAYYRDLAEGRYRDLTAAKATLATIQRALTGESDDIRVWARAYVHTNPEAPTRKIAAIKALREAFPGTSLRDAKDAIDRACGL